jgi:hypothetical protein
MTSRLVQVRLPNGTVTLVQAMVVDGEDPGGAEQAGWGDEDEEGGAEQVGWDKVFDLHQLSETLDGVAHAIKSGVEKAKPTKTTVELGLSLAVKSGILTSVIVDGKAQTSLTVTLEWGQ